MIILGFPSNPTARCVDLGFFERVIALAQEHGIYVVHDLAYADITFDDYQGTGLFRRQRRHSQHDLVVHAAAKLSSLIL